MADRLHVISDFNVDALARYLEYTALPGATVTTAPYGQVYQELATARCDPGATAIVWTRPEAVIDAFRGALASEPYNTDSVVDEVRRYTSALTRFAGRVRQLFVPTWLLPPWHRGYGPVDYRPGIGIGVLLARMNLELAESLAATPTIFVLDAQRWLTTVGSRGWSSKLWYAAKSPFTSVVFEQAAHDIVAALEAGRGRSRRLVVVDLDNVMWGGIVGETGWAELVLGGHDHVGEAYADFQRALKALRQRGIQIAIVSKNDEGVALEAIDRHPEMLLRRGDFAGWRINWQDKAQNVLDLLAELNLGAESAVFIDDSTIERERVRSAVPGILVPEWPADPARYVEALSSLRCFDTVAVTAEDRARGGMYADAKARSASMAEAGSVDDWLATLGVTVSVARLGDADLDRATQLFNKTNQMNMATRRLSRSELQAWGEAPGHALFTFRVADRFGDLGLTGVVGVAVDGDEATLVDYLLSCRVMGRNVEETMLHVAVAHSRVAGASRLVARFAATARNAPCLEFLRRSGFASTDGTTFTWDTTQPYDCPQSVRLVDTGAFTAAAR